MEKHFFGRGNDQHRDIAAESAQSWSTTNSLGNGNRITYLGMQIRLLLLCILTLFLFGCDGATPGDIINSGKPALPITISWRSSWISGLVLIVENESTEKLVFELHCKNTMHKQEMTYTIVLHPNQTKEFGLLELNWSFQPGEDVYFRHGDYRTWQIRVPSL